MGAAAHKDREEATAELIRMGPAIKGILQRHVNDRDPEIRHRLRLILEKME